MKRVAFIENVIPHYRFGYFQELSKHEDYEFTVYCQDSDQVLNLNLVHDELPMKVCVVNYWQYKRKLRWQFLPIRELWKNFDVYVFYANPRYASNVVWATVFRLAGKRVVLRNQVQTAGSDGIGKRLRLAWWKMFSAFLVYTDAEAQWLQSAGFEKKAVVGWNNGLDQSRFDKLIEEWTVDRLDRWKNEQLLGGKEVIVSIARLESKNKFELGLAAIERIKESHANILWCVIGDGKQRAPLEAEAEKRGVVDHVRFVGAIYDDQQLTPWLMTSRLLLHPGAIGLTLLHAFGFGLPVVTHGNPKNQMPEFGAFCDGENGLCFREGDVEDMVSKIVSLLRDHELQQRLAEGALSVARMRHNTKIMADRTIQLLDRVIHDA